ncbi:EAL domain-containing protein [Legionella maioricensis]|uniref:cyclic-guanylate-specific phosphodiesterase n=1 Tax=Legionella maioricensis TaxID=2896528 RepID=A0A9X2CZE6_9GAMM|nr:EAL domain-containing protein [Legionella maioricensis]MCL9683623.1 EAL domain-containing protein [Legionella maioricensis]MCL9687645.1 EAL domain-containing protein [Legionella maioricensis]
MGDIELHIMIIDDNPAIHQDFIKVLTSTNRMDEFSNLDKQLFDEDEFALDEASKHQMDYSLPKFIIDTANQGREGVEKIKKALEHDVHYALSFVDVKMPPGWDGIETIKHIWEVDPDIQIVICTAYSDYSWEETVKQLGMGDNYLILKKPFDVIAVKQLACALTKKWILHKDSKHHTKILQQTVEARTESLQQSLSLLRSTIESSTDGILVVDLNRIIIDCNSKFLCMWNIPDSMFKSKNVRLIIDYMLNQLDNSRSYFKQINYLDKHIDEVSKNTVIFKDGKILECYSQPHRLNDVTVGRVWSFRDITERAKLESKLEYQATHDSLTGLPNRALLIDRIQNTINSALENDQQFAILYFDLDRFKLINDSLSHEAGDKLLRLVAQRWSSLIRKEDTLARIGGDEFVMIFNQFNSVENIILVANKILESLDQPFQIDSRELNINTTIGISLFPKDGKTVNELLKSADLAMYQAKERGGNQFYFYAKYLNERTNKCFKMEAELRMALKNNEFFLLYQPQFSIDTENLLCAEALIRWNHPTRGLLVPLDFIPIAEDSGLIIPLGEWVLREVCRQIKAWHKKGLPLIRVAVNIATHQLRQTNFVDMVKGILKEYQLAPQCLEFEITENVVITHWDIIQMINQLKEIGIKIALDDFGTGNSSINYLKQIHIDCLKIDQSFVQNISTSRSDEVIIEAIIAMARSFNFKVLAEGVETQKQMDFLKQRNCDEVQGFLFSQPLTPKEIEKHIMQGILSIEKKKKSSPKN